VLVVLEGKNVNLRVIEREDLPLLAEWSNNPEYLGEFVWLQQQSRTEWEKRYDHLTSDTKWFFVEKKDGTKIGTMFHWFIGNLMEISCVLASDERGKGCGTEATKRWLTTCSFQETSSEYRLTRMQEIWVLRRLCRTWVSRKKG
jgi:RimJ/RimL family protein N-acetyltransferase